MLPQEHIKWFSEQPDSAASSEEIRNERHAVRYLHHETQFHSTSFFLDKIAGYSLTRKLDKLQEPIYEELSRSIDDIFGTCDNDWRTINLYGTLQEIIVPAMTRVFFGFELSHDSKFVTSFRRYVAAMGIGTIVIGQLPRMFKYLVVPLFNIPLRYYRRKTLNAVIPMVAHQMKVKEGQKDQVTASKDRNEFIIQASQLSARSNVLRARGADPKVLAEWVILLVSCPLKRT